MQIKVRLFATLREGRGKELFLDFDEKAAPADVFGILNIPLKEVAILMVNGLDARADHELKDGDTVSIFPPIGGG
jgi:sulfur-carrier protein